MSNDKGFFQSVEFRNLQNKYEQMRHNGTSSYFDISELSDLLSYYITNNNLNEGEEVYNLALQLHPVCDETVRMKARLLLAQGYPENALQATSALGNDNESLLLKADIHLALKQYKESRIAARKVLHNNSITEDIAYDALEILLDCGFAQEVQEYATEGLKDNPGNTTLLEVLAEAYIEQQKTDLAIKIYNGLLDENPYSTFYWEQLGHIYYMIGRYGKALECFEYELTIENDIEYAIMMQGFCYHKLKDTKKCIEIFSNMKNKYPDSIIPRFYIALSYSYEFNTFEALSEYNDILNLEYQREDYKIGIVLTLLNMAIILYKEGNSDIALEYMEDALNYDIPADEMKQLLIMGDPYYELKYKENMTFDDINSTEYREWAHYELYYNLGIALMHLGCIDLSIAALYKARSTASDTTEIDAYIAYLLCCTNGERDTIAAMIKSAIEGKSNKLFNLFSVPYNANLSTADFIKIAMNKFGR